MEEVIDKFTTLHRAGELEAAYQVISEAILRRNMQDPELYWRYADVALTLGRKDKKIYKKFVMEGFKAATEGLQMNPEHPNCNCWYGVFLNYISEMEGIRKRIQSAYQIRDYFQRALLAEPDNFVALHAMGRWCFEVSDVPMYQRLIAKAFFATPPTSSFKEGLEYLLKAEKYTTVKMPVNDICLAKTYHRLSDKMKSRYYCEKVLSSDVDDMEVEQAKKEAASMLKWL